MLGEKNHGPRLKNPIKITRAVLDKSPQTVFTSKAPLELPVLAAAPPGVRG